MLSWWLASPAGTAVKQITLDGQAISGTTPKYGHSDFRNGVDQLDADRIGFKIMCEALASSPIEVINMKSCHLGPFARQRNQSGGARSPRSTLDFAA